MLEVAWRCASTIGKQHAESGKPHAAKSQLKTARRLAVSVKRHVCKRQGCLMTSDYQQSAWQEAARRQLESGKAESVKPQATSNQEAGNAVNNTYATSNKYCYPILETSV